MTLQTDVRTDRGIAFSSKSAGIAILCSSIFANNDMHLPICKFSLLLILGAPRENASSGIYEQRNPKSACASVQPNQGLRCPLPESFGTVESMNREQRPR